MRIHNSVENQQFYNTVSPIGTKLKAKRTRAGIQILYRRNHNEIILPTNHAVRYIESKLIKESGKKPAEAKVIAQQILETPNKEIKKFNEGFSIVRWDGEQFALDFSSNKLCDERAYILIAFEYLGLILGRSIYNEGFQHIRSGILKDDRPELVNVQLFTSKKPQPFHLIYPEFEEDRIRINIHLFEYAIAQVEFLKIRVNSQYSPCYLEDLVNRTSLGSYTVEDAKSNIWREYENS
ncbi:MAG: hypothetical protein H0W89_03595 [Candidatus Levybacteria bacterium]|nr:hypothetical protein [Candidatus Levybacteria bacterium]